MPSGVHTALLDPSGFVVRVHFWTPHLDLGTAVCKLAFVLNVVVASASLSFLVMEGWIVVMRAVCDMHALTGVP